MQIILKLTKNFRITFFKKFEKIVVFKTPLLIFVLKFSEYIKVYFKHISKKFTDGYRRRISIKKS